MMEVSYSVLKESGGGNALTTLYPRYVCTPAVLAAMLTGAPAVIGWRGLPVSKSSRAGRRKDKTLFYPSSQIQDSDLHQKHHAIISKTSSTVPEYHNAPDRSTCMGSALERGLADPFD